MVINSENLYLDNNTGLSTCLTQAVFVEMYFVNPEVAIGGVFRIWPY